MLLLFGIVTLFPTPTPEREPMAAKPTKLVFRPVIDHVIRVKDGDTVDLMLDLGFDTYRKQTVRFQGVDTPEISTEAGKAVAVWLTAYLQREALKHPLYLDSRDYDKFGGRVLGDIYLGSPTGTSVVLTLLHHSLGRAYKGTKRQPWTPAELDAVLAAVKRAPSEGP